MPFQQNTQRTIHGHSDFSRRHRYGYGFQVSAGSGRRTPDGGLRALPGPQGAAAAQLESAPSAGGEHSMAVVDARASGSYWLHSPSGKRRLSRPNSDFFRYFGSRQNRFAGFRTP